MSCPMEDKNITNGFVRLAGFAAPFRGRYLASAAWAVLGVACAMIPYAAVSQVIIRLAQGQRSLGGYLAWFALAALGYLCRVWFHGLSTRISHLATFAVISQIRRRIAAKLARVPMGYILNTPSGRLKNTLVEKAASIEPALSHVLPEMTANLLIPLVIISTIFFLDWRMALISLITLPVGAFCFMMMMKDYQDQYAGYMAAGKQMNAAAVEYINGIEVIKTFGGSAASHKKFAHAVSANAEYGVAWTKSVQGYFAMSIGIWPSVLIGVLPLGCLFLQNGSLSASVFITIMILALGIFPCLLSILFYLDDLAKIGTTMNDIGDVLDQKELKRPDAFVVPGPMDIKLSGVGFSYGRTRVLDNLSLVIPQGRVTALVGPSGSGKSTIARLITSFWDVDKGAVTIGGTDVKNIPFEQLNGWISYVAQDNYLFDTTVMENIRMGDPKASDQAVMDAAKAAGCHGFITALEQGYHTMTGGGGTRLSGGERQRITIARAMLKNAPVVILDEATAYADPANEARLQQAIAGLVRGKTLIVIAHRLSTITNADRIVVLNQGQIQGIGTHRELLSGCGLYRQMWHAHVSVKDEPEKELCRG